MAQQSNPGSRIADQWQDGRSWKVEYEVVTPSDEKHANPAPTAPERSLWNYEVTGAARDGLILIRMSEEKGSRIYELAFDRLGPTLRRVVKISDTFRDTVIENPGRDAYTGWSLRYPAIFDWPLLNVAPGGVHEFHAGPWLAAETVNVTGGTVETTMSYTDKKSDQFIEKRRVTQVWNPANPWWSTATIEAGFLVDGKRSRKVLIAGRLIEP